MGQAASYLVLYHCESCDEEVKRVALDGNVATVNAAASADVYPRERCKCGGETFRVQIDGPTPNVSLVLGRIVPETPLVPYDFVVKFTCGHEHVSVGQFRASSLGDAMQQGEVYRRRLAEAGRALRNCTTCHKGIPNGAFTRKL